MISNLNGKAVLKKSPTPTSKIIDVAYEQLVEMIDNDGLVQEQKYKIIDYETTLSQNIDYAKVEQHSFDVVVIAKNNHELYTAAKASVRDSNSNYFTDDLDDWELMYDVENNRWSDPINGKGTIYYMKDGYGNECYYDFKQITFKRYKIIDSPNNSLNDHFATDHIPNITVDYNDYIYCYTFCYYFKFQHTTRLEDDSNIGISKNNKIGRYTSNEVFEVLNNIVTFGDCKSNVFYDGCNNITLSACCYENEFSYNSRDILFGNYCQNNKFINIRDKSLYETHGIILSDDCCFNTFNGCAMSIYFNNDCSFNTFGDNTNSINFGEYCTNNSFKSNCFGISFGDYCSYNAFGNSCMYIKFYYIVSDDGDYASYVKYNTIGDNVSYILLFHTYSSIEDQETYPIQNCIVLPGLHGSDVEDKEFEIPYNENSCIVLGSIYMDDK